MAPKLVSASLGKHGFVVLLLALFMSACGAAPQQPTSSAGASTPTRPSTVASASAAPSTSTEPSPSQTASSAPSAAPSASASVAASAAPSSSGSAVASPAASDAGSVLPAPLLFAREGQIVRMERDGKTITQLTAEQPGQPGILAITDFDVSPVDGSLAYVVQDTTGNSLVRTDATGKQRTLLMPNAFANIPRWSPDGSQIAFVGGNPPEQNSAMPAGVYLIPATGGTPRLLQANDKVDPNNPSADARGYSPVAWSPDGTKLLLSAYSMTVEICGAVIKDVKTGTVTPIQAPEGLMAGCASGRWSPDGKLIYTSMARPGPQPPVPGLWTVDPETGASTPFLQGQFENGFYQLVTNYHPLEDGSVYAFVAEVDTLPDPFGGDFPAYQLAQRSQTDGMVLREEPLAVTGQALWALDKSGAVVDVVAPGSANGVVTAWVPLSGGSVVELGPFMGEAKQWVRE